MEYPMMYYSGSVPASIAKTQFVDEKLCLRLDKFRSRSQPEGQG